MAAQVFTINPEAFVEALKELPLSSVYAKVSELRNSIAHLHRSNAEMRAFMESSETEEEKREMEGYIRENEGVFKSMEERLGMLRNEVERRGQRWIEESEDGDDAKVQGGRENGDGDEVVNLNGRRVDSTENQGGDNSEEGVYL
ncbi:uncharacterized protein N7469_006756 [Penicillium citrinum]|uniref:Uncharacterized protein n=2 Tax=Penicillium TaxID=5073 RepID=A0A9W9NVB6_PENCI|nr:uncharacterized protein N7469_006756 [Penicillium citrinum]KAJ5226750.1 hypothetical protein N7469_006756 [Penicillium citrinum]KAJ5568791.1 hypothetical protein N7450_011277 [Penicillium hetheringtonii]KAK5791050.1 hypothetical protein VI817_006359 [Penicillium citrinum]